MRILNNNKLFTSALVVCAVLLCSSVWAGPTCKKKDKYRSFDGRCNNLFFENSGASNTPFFRRYGINNLPDPSQPITGTDFIALELPAPRKISNTLKAAEPLQYDERDLSLLFVFFGQFLAHDFADLHVDLGGLFRIC